MPADEHGVTPEGEADRRDSSDHVKHLRTVHFAMVIACFALLAGSILSAKSDAQRAEEDLREIMNVLTAWQCDWLEKSDVVALDADVQLPKELSHDWYMLANYCPNFYSVKFAKPFMTIYPMSDTLKEQAISNRDLHATGNPCESSSSIPRFQKPRDIMGFENLWNALNDNFTSHIPDVVATTGPLTRWSPGRGGTSVFELTEELLCPKPVGTYRLILYDIRNFSPKFVRESLLEYLPEELGSFSVESTTHVFRTPWPGQPSIAGSVFTLPVIAKKVGEFNGQLAFNDFFKVDFDLGTFRYSFPALARITEKYTDIPMERVQDIVAGEASRSDERVEFLGTKVPISELAKLGIPVVLGFQIYFFLHLSAFGVELSSRDPAAQFPWIGVYSGPAPRIATIASAFLFPSGVVVLLAVKNAARDLAPWLQLFDLRDVGPWLQILALGGMGLSCLIAWLSFRCMARIWRTLQS